MGKGRNWTTHDEDILRSGYDDPSLQLEDIADVLKRSRDSIASQAKRLGLKKATHEVPPP